MKNKTIKPPKIQTKYSPKYIKYLKNLKKDVITTKIYQFLILAIFLVLWEILALTGVLDPFFFSSPSRICKTLIELFATGNLLGHIFITLGETILGFVIATVLGSLIAIALWWSDKLRKVLDPYIVVLNSLPKIALGPLIIISPLRLGRRGEGRGCLRFLLPGSDHGPLGAQRLQVLPPRLLL